MEIWEDISLHIVKPYTLLIGDPRYSKLAFQGIANISQIQFQYDMKIRELNHWLVQTIAKMMTNKDSTSQQALATYN